MPDTRPARRLGRLVLGASSAVLLGATFLHWYAVYVVVDVVGRPLGPPAATYSAWRPFTAIDVVLVVTAALAGALTLIPVARKRPSMSSIVVAIVVGLATCSAVLVVIRLANPPVLFNPHGHGIDTRDEQRLAIGGFVAIVGAVGVAGGASLIGLTMLRRASPSAS
jgi:hypothetical protein